MEKVQSKSDNGIYLDFSSEKSLSKDETTNKTMDGKRSSFLQTMSESFNNNPFSRSQAMITDKKNGRKFSTSHQSIKFYRQRTAIYLFLQKPINVFGKAYHLMISALILSGIVLTILSTFDEISVTLNRFLYGCDSLIMIILIIELSVRFWASECVSHYRGVRGKIKFFLSPFRMIDITVIITSLLIVLYSTNDNDYMVPSLQWIRIFQTFIMLRFEHNFRSWRVMGSVIWDHRQHLYITSYLSFLVFLLTAFLIYFVERNVNPVFTNLGQSIWWTVVTLCTIGYGDIYPVTTAGKIFASVAAILGVSIFALPAGILGTGLALKVGEEQRYKKIGKRAIPAAQLIQSRWRLHRLYESPDYCPVFRVKSSLTTEDINMKKILTPIERNCLIFILKTKFLVSRRYFEEALKPYDVRDVLEQYSSVHLEMLARIKHISHKISSVEEIVQSDLRAQNESKTLIVQRLDKLEEFMSDMDSKLNQLLKIQNENQAIPENMDKFNSGSSCYSLFTTFSNLLLIKTLIITTKTIFQ